MSSAAVRASLVDTLRLDLVGPDEGRVERDAEARARHYLHERLRNNEAPSRFYLTGFLVPEGAPPAQRYELDPDEKLDAAAPDEDASKGDATAAKKPFLPSSMGLSVILAPNVNQLAATVRWGEYRPVSDPTEENPKRRAWERSSMRRELALPVGPDGVTRHALPESRGVYLELAVRALAPHPGLDPALEGCKVVSVFLVNGRDPDDEERRDTSYLFQAKLALACEAGFTRRRDLRDGGGDADARIADLQYRDVCEFAVGHGVSATATIEAGGCKHVETEWLPSAEVERVEAAALTGVELGMEKLATLDGEAAVRAALSGLPAAYAKWIDDQPSSGLGTAKRDETAADLLHACRTANDRIRAGIELVATDDQVRTAFRLMNAAMALAARQRGAQEGGKPPDAQDPPSWRPFQLAFVLLNLRGVNDPVHPDREAVELLFFPTGGGKTEAYLGLAAFAILLRRLRRSGPHGAGVAVFMRYTLRLLTLDQLARAATLVCALERLREARAAELGTWPFEIGLWVGDGATPNRMGRVSDQKDRSSARVRTIRYRANPRHNDRPVPLTTCPWCGARLEPDSFELVPDTKEPTNLRVRCGSASCPFTGDRGLPVVVVDEVLYRRLPCFVIATLDKVASLPWVGASGKLFGGADRHDAEGFYGPADGRAGQPLPAPLLPPELVIQDELHLISGPLGSVAGIYEVAVERLATAVVDGQKLRPKLVASTATVRRAAAQVTALFGRAQTNVFPPPGPERHTSFFAETRPLAKTPGRLYLGVAAPGRSAKVVLLKVYLALLSGAFKHWKAADKAGVAAGENPADPYVTLLGYFNSLRELGGSRRIVEDEVFTRAMNYWHRRRYGETDETAPFVDHPAFGEVLELTSRVSTGDVAEARQRLKAPYERGQGRWPVDVALATNMISVGLDIPRLGVLAVLGQPKTTAEYIQATSRVGRKASAPGLVVTMLNVHKARDRSHYERFTYFHETFYRAVESTSVTPFAPRCLDRALPAVTVALARHGVRALVHASAAKGLAPHRLAAEAVVEAVAERARGHTVAVPSAELEALAARTRLEAQSVLDRWQKAAHEANTVGTLAYQKREPGTPATAVPLLKAPLSDGPGTLVAPRSLRDVEPDVWLLVRPLP